jgi:ribonuclease HI
MYITDTEGNPVARRYRSIGIATNNMAEYTAALCGIECAIELGATEIELRADSQLLIEQLSGNYKIKNVHLKEVYTKISTLVQNW